MRKFLNKYLIFLIGLISNGLAVGDELHIAAIYLDIRLEKKAESPYYKILTNLAKELDFKTHLGVYPVKRAAKYFLEDRESCILPSTINIVKMHYPKETKNFNLIQSDPMELITSRVFSRKGEKTIKDFKELEGKTLISWLGIPAKIMIPNVNFKEIKAKSDQQAIAILNAKRGDYLLGWTPDTAMVAIKNKYAIPEFNKKLMVMETSINVVCHSTDKTKKLIRVFNNILRKMKASGEMHKLLGPYSVIPN